MSTCDVCSSFFETKQAAKQHKKATKHCVCPHCDKPLASSHGLQAHIDAVHQYECPQCPAVLAEKRLLTNHQKSQGHCYCGDCNKTFGTVHGFNAHLQSSRHSTEFRCCDCDREFNSTSALEQHLRDKVHRRPSASTRLKSGSDNTNDIGAASGLQCTKCAREFASEHALSQHLASLTHRPLGEFACFAGSSCAAKFTSPSAVLHHLESGACPSGMDRDQMRALIMKYDVDRLVTRLPAIDDNVSITASSDEDSLLVRQLSNLSISPAMGSCLTPASSTPTSGCFTPASDSLSDWTALIARSSTHHCPFCPPERRPFRDAAALRQHIGSAAHSEPFIYCPSSVSGGKHGLTTAIRTFNTVAGLAQHLESGACVGGVDSFWEAVKYLETRFQEMGMQLRLVQDGTV